MRDEECAPTTSCKSQAHTLGRAAASSTERTSHAGSELRLLSSNTLIVTDKGAIVRCEITQHHVLGFKASKGELNVVSGAARCTCEAVASFRARVEIRPVAVRHYFISFGMTPCPRHASVA